MKCPFRKDKEGEFNDCLGPSCMAYYETEYFVPKSCEYQTVNFACNTKTAIGCRMFTQIPASLYTVTPSPSWN